MRWHVMFVNMYTQGTGQCVVTHDKTGVDLYTVIVCVCVLSCVFTLFRGGFKSTTLLIRAHTEYNGNAHARDRSVYSHTWWNRGGSLYCCCAYLLCLAGVLKARTYWCVRILRGKRGNLHGTDVTCHLINIVASDQRERPGFPVWINWI